MLSEGNTNLIKSVETSDLNGHYIEILHFFDERVLVLDASAIALYKNARAINDPLGNGLIHFMEIPQAYQLPAQSTPWVVEHRAGYVGLADNKVLLILPKAIRLYPSKQNALNNQQLILELPFTH